MSGVFKMGLAPLATCVPRVAVICDMHEENWPSMDLVAEMLLGYLEKDHADSVAATRVCLSMRRRFTRGRSVSGSGFTADRFLSRFWDYPRWVGRRQGEFDLFHIVDHSYAHLVHKLPRDRTVVTCHDVDAFRCVFDGSQDRLSAVRRVMARHVLGGLRKASRITCNSFATRDALARHGLCSRDRVTVIHNGVDPACSPTPDPAAETAVESLLGPATGSLVEILHVGSTVARKRIDVLLAVFAAVRREIIGARLIRVGGPFSRTQTRLVAELGLNDAVVGLPFLDRAVVPAVYRRASVLLLPSEREGFGLPVLEALACGVPVVASDLPALQEIGGEATIYCPVGNIAAWTESVLGLLHERAEKPDRWSARRSAGLAQAARFSWAEYARKTLAVYRDVLGASVSGLDTGA